MTADTATVITIVLIMTPLNKLLSGVVTPIIMLLKQQTAPISRAEGAYIHCVIMR